jgi:hypothetical protein
MQIANCKLQIANCKLKGENFAVCMFLAQNEIMKETGHHTNEL